MILKNLRVYRWGAIAMGAVIQAVARRVNAPYWQVVSRRATSHFGIEIQVPFDESVHTESQK